jgi:hypothetical protein
MSNPEQILRRKTQMWTKPYLQMALKELRKSGYKVERLDHGYTVIMPDEPRMVVLKALTGSRGYLVSFDQKLFDESYEEALNV